jgi:isoleucyl-tRNA synthetase
MPHLEGEKAESVFLNQIPSADLYRSEGVDAWDKLFELRDDVMKALEIARAQKLIGKSLDAKVTIYTENEEILNLLNSMSDELATVFIVSKATVVGGTNPDAYTEEGSVLAVLVEQADGKKCDRCWCYSEEGIESEEDGFLCERCRKILGL